MKRYLLPLTLFASSLMACDFELLYGAELAKTGLTESELRRLYLGKLVEHSSGVKIIPVALKRGCEHEAFTKHVVRKSPKQFKIHWDRLNYTGRAMRMLTFESNEEMRAFIRSTPYAVGYVRRGD